MSMNMPLKAFLFAALATMLLAAPLAAAWAGVEREDIVVLRNDGQHYTVYKTLRSGLSRRNLSIGDDSPTDYIFIHPDDFKPETANGTTVLQLNQGSYALLKNGQFSDSQITHNDDGSYTFHSWTGKQPADGHFGKWNSPGKFGALTYVWVLPDNIHVIGQKSNRSGRWSQSKDTLVWQGKNVNDVTFTITYRVNPVASPANAGTTQAASSADTSQDTLIDTSLLFASGAGQLDASGQKRLKQIARIIKHNDVSAIIIKGYSDNQSLKPDLRKKYSGNLGLSAARAAGVADWLTGHGVKASLIQIRAYGAGNSSASGSASRRAHNRRIEIVVTK